MQALYAHKLFRGSTRKAEIVAAVNDPSNLRLVTQLSSYLDPEYRKEEYLVRPESEPEVTDIPEEPEAPDDFLDLKDDFGAFPSGGGFSGMPDDMVGPDMEGDAPPEEEPEATSEETSPESMPEIDEPEIDDISGVEEIEASRELSTSEIKNMLNELEDTAGVNRILRKGSEIWIYYEDSMNLNKIMGTVVEALNDAYSGKLSFNRLARSDNAIVFEVEDEEV